MAEREPCAAEDGPVLRVTDRVVAPGGPGVVLRLPSLVIGVGASRGVPAEEVLGLIAEALREGGLSPLCVAALATADAKAAEPGIVAAARRLGVPLVTHPPERLAAVPVPHPSAAPLAAVGTPSVAEAAALAGGGELLVPKRKSRPVGRSAMATCAVVRRAPPEWLVPVGPGTGLDDREAGAAAGPVRAGSRADGSSRPPGMAGVDPAAVDMMTVVMVGSTATRTSAGHVGIPRGRRWRA